MGERWGRGGWGRTFKTPLASADASAAVSLSVAGDTGGGACALGAELEGGGAANDMMNGRSPRTCDERSRPCRADDHERTRVAVAQQHLRARADDSPGRPLACLPLDAARHPPEVATRATQCRGSRSKHTPVHHIVPALGLLRPLKGWKIWKIA